MFMWQSFFLFFLTFTAKVQSQLLPQEFSINTRSTKAPYLAWADDDDDKSSIAQDCSSSLELIVLSSQHGIPVRYGSKRKWWLVGSLWQPLVQIMSSAPLWSCEAQLCASMFFLVTIMALLICSNETNITTFHDPNLRNDGTNLWRRKKKKVRIRWNFKSKHGAPVRETQLTPCRKPLAPLWSSWSRHSWWRCCTGLAVSSCTWSSPRRPERRWLWWRSRHRTLTRSDTAGCLWNRKKKHNVNSPHSLGVNVTYSAQKYFWNYTINTRVYILIWLIATLSWLFFLHPNSPGM